MTATVTTDFRQEFEAERTRWLRRRFLWYSGFLSGWWLLLTVLALPVWLSPGAAGNVGAAEVAANALSALFFFGAFLFVFRTPLDQQELIRLVFWLIVINGAVRLATTSDLVQTEVADSSASAAIAGVFLSHFFASLFLPWTPREAIRPLVPLLLIYAALTLLTGEGSFVGRVIAVALSPVVGAPGVAWSAWRHGRFRERFQNRVLRRTYGEMKRELTDARKIHEALFPPPVTDGPVRLLYRYEPMRQIGGDFLYARGGSIESANSDGDQPLSAVIVDVTGHGIAAALTVNRLYGELERLFGERPDLEPGEALSALNSYAHYTLASHSVYLTALCVRVDPSRESLEWASGGHPPAFLRTADGRIDRLESTAFVLGACHGDDFQPGQQCVRFAPGDALIAYTDGAIESRDDHGRMLGLDGFQRLVASLKPDAGAANGWAPAILRAVDEHRAGPPADDTLIVEIYRPLEV